MTTLKYPSTEIKVTGLDTRLFGSRCLDTVSVATIADLAELMLDAVLGIAVECRFEVRYHYRNHVTLLVGGALSKDEPDAYEVAWATASFTAAVNQFNWIDPGDDLNRRFTFCGVMLLDYELSEAMSETGKVTMAEDQPCACRYRD